MQVTDPLFEQNIQNTAHAMTLERYQHLQNQIILGFIFQKNMHVYIGLCEFFLIRVCRLLCTCTQHDDDEYLMLHTNYMSHLKMFDDILIGQNKKRIYHNLWVENKEGYKLTETPKAHRAQWKSVQL